MPVTEIKKCEALLKSRDWKKTCVHGLKPKKHYDSPWLNSTGTSFTPPPACSRGGSL